MDEQTAAQMYARAMGSRDDASEGHEETQIPSFEMAFPSVAHDTTMQTSNVSTPEQRRERAMTDESANTTGSNLSVSKQSLVRLMREQVDLVRSLTNAQIAQKKELEQVKAENKRLEEQQKRRTAGYSQSQTLQSKSLNLPTRVSRDTSDSRSVSSRSFAARYFQRSPRTSRRQQARHPHQHPDADYYHGSSRGGSPGNDDQTTANHDPSMASTILPTAIVIDAAKANTTGAFVDQFAPNYTGPGAHGGSKDKIEITRIPERNVVPENEHSCTSKAWWLLSRVCTLFIPDLLLCCIGRHALVKKGMTSEEKKAVRATRREAKQAWREKVTIFFLMLFCCACFIGISGVIPMFLCRETTVFTMDDIRARDRTEDWTVIFGTIYDIQDYNHPGGDTIRKLIAKDSSKVFPRRPPGRLPSVCTDFNKDRLAEAVCSDFDEVDELIGLHCHRPIGFSGLNRVLGDYERGILSHRLPDLENDKHTDFVTVHGRVYNVTSYLESIKDEESRIDPDSENAYLSEDLNSLIINKRGSDATFVYDALFDDDVPLSCLDDLFYIGILEEQENFLCRALNIAMYAIMIAIASVLGIQCICSLMYLVRMKRTITRDDTRTKMIIMVPCYNEGNKELRKTIDSVMDTTYPDDNKVLLVVADGNITGKGEKISTPETLSKILGFEMKSSDKSYSCNSIGDLTENRAKVYHGIYKDAGKELKYIVIVKTGLVSERGNPRAGNRGKRDSQLLFTGLLNRFHHGRELNELDMVIKNSLYNLQLPLDEVRYLMAIDADTRIDRESLSHMAYSMNKNERVLALCGETKVDNKAQSWVTMIQVFEYYTNHHMKKAFESCFGCVTCLPGCFTMYRLYSDDGRPLLSSDDVYQRYATNNVKTLHDKNLFHLGEDRMLTTLLLRYFPDMKLSFVPEATCYTIVPHTFSVLLSQRRRWINSTFHNMLELMRVQSMCGICCLSMKAVVVLDLIATLILPASLVYVGYIVFITFWMGEPLSLLMLVVWGIVVGVQVAVFLLRSRWDYCWWFLIFCIFGVPVFYFILPLYSFWHMDDFSWGSTRQVSGAPQQVKDIASGSGSRDETVNSERVSPVNFPARPSPGDAGSAKLNLKPKLHSSPVDVDNLHAGGEEFSQISGEVSTTRFDPKKYRDAQEAKNARRSRRGEC